jgi:Regulator of chromosome condensation (RCC1) repeat
VGRSGFLVVLTRQGIVYTWGSNDAGQLGHRDTVHRSTPHRVEALNNKRSTQIACGRDFVIALGLTLPHKELENLNKKKKMLDEATKINQETREQIALEAEQHKRSSSKLSVQLRREYDSHHSAEGKSPSNIYQQLSGQKAKTGAPRVKSALNINNS